MREIDQQTLRSISAQQIRTHIQMLEGVRHPVIAPEALDRAADYFRSTLDSLGYEVSEHHFVDDGHDYRNVLGLRRGSRYPDKRVIVLAHYDTEPETPGADDNASGVAAVLELARVFQPLAFEASVQFVGVSLEERKWGVEPEDVKLDRADEALLRGSRALAAHAQANAWDIEGVINFEGIAYAGDTIAQDSPKGMPIELPEVGNFIALVGNEHSVELVQGFAQSIERNHIPLPYVPLVVPGNGEMLPDTRRSDHSAFWDAGYRAIMVTDTANFRSPHYHRPSDTLETLNLDFAVQVCRAAGGLVMDMAGLVDAEKG